MVGAGALRNGAAASTDAAGGVADVVEAAEFAAFLEDVDPGEGDVGLCERVPDGCRCRLAGGGDD